MILTVTLNAALDITYRLPHVAHGEVNRVDDVAERAGGKGVNVARVLSGLGVPVVVTGLAGGSTGATLRAGLRADGLADGLFDVHGETRRTLTVVEVEADASTGLYERGPHVTEGEWHGFADHFRSLAEGARVVVLSGSLPSGVPDDAYARLGDVATAQGAAVVLDAGGAALRAGLAARPDIVKPNAAELRAATGRTDTEAAARLLRDQGARAVVASLGPAGILALTGAGDDPVRLAPPYTASGNPTGAGDAAVAALALGLRDGWSWPERLAHAVALSTAAVRAPLAGEFDAAEYRRLCGLLGATVHGPFQGDRA